MISIHALRVEGDKILPKGAGRHGISIHALRVEGDPSKEFTITAAKKFLSTPSGWRATTTGIRNVKTMQISIHALRVEGDSLNSVSAVIGNMISIHALRVEGDGKLDFTIMQMQVFLSTPSGWRATKLDFTIMQMQLFLSTPSGWRATGRHHCTRSIYRFLSTPSGWRATSVERASKSLQKFLSTPSGWRATASSLITPCISILFLSTPSGWRATIVPLCRLVRTMISIHALRVEGDLNI